MATDPKDMKPGGTEAVDHGCTCQPWDGEYARNPRWPLWLVDGCPLHDPRLNGELEEWRAENG